MDTERQSESSQSNPRGQGNVKQVRVILSPDANATYLRLESEAGLKLSRSLVQAINEKIELITSNVHYGQQVAKHLIPAEYRVRYCTTNVFHVKLPQFWRMLYSLEDGEGGVVVIVFILDILDHPSYDKKFGYKRR